MAENKGPLLIVVVIILFGLAFKPLVEKVDKNKSGEVDTPKTREAILGSTKTKTSTESPSASIKSIQKDIDNVSKALQKNIEASKRSPYYGKINMSNISGRNNPDPNKEYIKLSVNLREGEQVKLTGWYLKSEVTNYFVIIGKAALLPFPSTHTESDIVLKDGDKVILTKGFSPIGISFRTNKCTGYFEENRTFYPGLSKQCPLPINDQLPRFSSIEDRNDECLNLIKRVPRCTTRDNEYIRDLPDTVSSSCKTYLKTQINYNSCVSQHLKDTDFPGTEYRVYLNKFGTLWKKEREKISLYDQNGLVVDSIDY